MRNTIRGIIVLAFATIASAPAGAAIVQLVGDNIIYEYDNVANAAALSLFGTPTIAGDVVRFAPPSFRAESVDGAGIDTATANFIFNRVYTIGGGEIAEIKVIEFGDYEIIDDYRVSLDLLLTASSNVNFLDFTSDSASLDYFGDSAGLQTWLVSTSIMPAADFTSAANDMLLSIQNTLQAETNAQGQSAWIQKKLAFIASTTPNPVIPVPGAVWLFGSALGLLTMVRRRMKT